MMHARTSNVEAAKLLLKHGAKVKCASSWRGQTALMWAAAEAQPDMVKLLVRMAPTLTRVRAVNDWERQVTAEPRKQARPPVVSRHCCTRRAAVVWNVRSCCSTVART